jgi:hypothetical protein
MRLVMSDHVVHQAAERDLDLAWVKRVALRPDWTEPDSDPARVRHFGVLPERGGRVLRVIVSDHGRERRVITAHLDRKAARRRP